MQKLQSFLLTPLTWRSYSLPIWTVLVGFVMLIIIVLTILTSIFSPSGKKDVSGILVTIHDSGQTKTIVSESDTISEVLEEAGIAVQNFDTVEPSVDTKLVAESYSVNIYRARPIAVKDGNSEVRITTAAQTGRTIAKAANITLDYEDVVDIESNIDVLENDGAIMVATVKRAVPVRLILYGQENNLKTQAKTVGEFITEKGLKVSDDDSVIPSRETEITPNMVIRIWREGINTVTVEEEILFDTKQVYDYDQFIGYHEVDTIGVNGKRAITYEIDMRGGEEVGREQIQIVTLKEPVTQVEVVGVKSRGGTTSASENERITWFYLRNQGFSREQTAGIMGNLKQEHGFQTSDAAGGLGIAQWTSGRRANLLRMNDPYSIYTQLDYLMVELNGGYRYVKNNLLSATSIEQATRIFQDQFERCGICREERRIQYAYEIYGRY